MANNTRALKLKANSEEYDSKLADIKRLAGFLERIMNEIYSEKKIGGVQGSFWTIDRDLFVGSSTALELKPFKLEFWRFTPGSNGTQLKRDSQLTLAIVRRVHDNLDEIIKYVEALCTSYAMCDELEAKKARFGM